MGEGQQGEWWDVTAVLSNHALFYSYIITVKQASS